MGTIVDQDPLKVTEPNSVAAASSNTPAETPIITASFTTVEKVDNSSEDVGTMLDMSDVRFTPKEVRMCLFKDLEIDRNKHR